MFALEREGARSQLLKHFNGEHVIEQQEQPTRGCPLYISGLKIVSLERLIRMLLTTVRCSSSGAGSSVEIGRVVSDPISSLSFTSAVALLRVAEVVLGAFQFGLCSHSETGFRLRLLPFHLELMQWMGNWVVFMFQHSPMDP